MFFRIVNHHVRRNTVAALTRHYRLQVPRILTVANQQHIASFHHSPFGAASMPEGWNASNAHPIVQKIRQNPKVMEHLVEFTLLLQKKGIDVAGKQPGFSDMMKIMNDPEIKEVVKNLAQEMQTAGIQLDMQSIGEIQKSLESFQQPVSSNQKTNQEDQNEEQGGVVNKMKGFFKK